MPSSSRTGRPRTYCSTHCRRVAEFARRRARTAAQRVEWNAQMSKLLGVDTSEQV